MDEGKIKETFRKINDLIHNCNTDALRNLIDTDEELKRYISSNNVWDGNENAFWNSNWSPLHTAVRYGRESIVRTLVEEFSIDVNARQNYRTWSGMPIHAAIYWNKHHIVQILVGYGASSEYGGSHWDGSSFGNAKEYCHVKGQREEIIGILDTTDEVPGKIFRDLIVEGNLARIKAYLDENEQLRTSIGQKNLWNWTEFVTWSTNWSPLHLAVSLGQEATITMLVKDYGLEINAKHVYGKQSLTPLQEAVSQNNISLVKLLLSHGADVKLNGIGVDGRKFQSALDYAQMLPDRGEIAQLLQQTA